MPGRWWNHHGRQQVGQAPGGRDRLPGHKVPSPTRFGAPMKKSEILRRLVERLPRGEITEKTYLEIKARDENEPEEDPEAPPEGAGGRGGGGAAGGGPPAGPRGPGAVRRRRSPGPSSGRSAPRSNP